VYSCILIGCMFIKNTCIFYLGTWGQGGNVTTLSFIIDGGLAQTESVPVVDNQGDLPHYSFYATNVTDGPHTLIVSASAGDNANFYLDYFIIIQSAGTSVDQGALLFYDDTDPAFQYSGSWSTGNVSPNNMQSTAHGANALNASATLNFTGIFYTYEHTLATFLKSCLFLSSRFLCKRIRQYPPPLWCRLCRSIRHRWRPACYRTVSNGSKHFI
jgi:hypothetical protein